MSDKSDVYDDTEIHKAMNDFSKELDKIIEDTVDEILKISDNKSK